MRFNTNIDADKTPAELLAAFYKEFNLPPDGGQSLNTVHIEVFKGFYFYIPNPPARKKVVILHDIHHLVTQYSSSFTGEAEISAWEIGSKCGKHWLAWAIDASGMMFGVLYDLPGVYRAYVRGRHSANLYHETISEKAALSITVNTLREQLHVPPPDSKVKGTFSDIVAFLFTLLFGVIYSIASIILLPAIILYNIWILIRGKY